MANSRDSPYAYPTPNSELLSSLKLEAHPEGGFFIETDRVENEVKSPFAGDKPRMLATQIYYLLSPESPRGRMHLNLSSTFHLHHAGRARYTLARPSPSHPNGVEIKRITMGDHADLGEVRQLFVEGGWWKASEMPEEDLVGAEEEEEIRERRGCLISEVVVPGFHWEDHKFLDLAGLSELFHGDTDAEGYKLLASYVKPIEGKQAQ